LSVQPTVLQVVILRDGLLVGTEVFVPGQYIIGSGPTVDLRLDDPTIQAAHATLYFQNGRSAIQDTGGGVYVNGHRVNACEVRSVDEVSVGPFSLKIRVMAQKPTKAGPPPEVAALLGGAPPAPPPRAVSSPPPSAKPVPVHAAANIPATVVSTRRSGAAPAVAPAPKAQTFRATATEEVTSLEAIEEAEPIGELPATSLVESVGDMHTVPLPTQSKPPPPPPVSAPPARAAAAPEPVRAKPAPSVEPTRSKTAPNPAPEPRAKPPPPLPPKAEAKPTAKAKLPLERTAEVARPLPARTLSRPMPSLPAPSDGKGKPHLFIEVYWGETRRLAKSFKVIKPKKKVIARPDDASAMPLFGFKVPEAGFTLADQAGPGVFRLFVPPGAGAERKAQDGNFYPVQADSLEKSAAGACVTLGPGHAIRLSGDDDMTLVAYVQPAIPKPFVNPLRGLPWLVLVFLAIFGSAFGAFSVYFVKMPEEADFQGRKINPVAVRLIQPPKPEEKKKIEEKLEKVAKKKPEVKPTKVEKVLPKAVAQDTKKALKSVEKLMAAGPAMKDLLAAVDKLGSGPGLKNAKNNMKMSDLLGKAPVAAAGLGSFGLGGGGGGGLGIKGAELLRGKGGAGIGALGAGNIGKGAVGGQVTHAVARSVSAQGTIDKDAVAKVINSHLHEVSSCYERALLKEPGLAGKIVLEWNISTAGLVTTAKTKSSTMKSAAVEQCILGALKGWKFPPAQGAGVVISYPFMFNSVGY
jgi:hypothetical protein